jgi:hypothetical protein
LPPVSLTNRYGAIPFDFPASVQLEGLGALSGALVCRQRHDIYAVVSEKKLLLTGTGAEVDPYLEEWCRVAVDRVCEALELVKEAEMERFSEKSYFCRKMNGLSPADSDEDPTSCSRLRGTRGGRGCRRFGGRGDRGRYRRGVLAR